MAKLKRQFLVVVVDDDAGLLEATDDLLSSNGFRARGFSSAEEFLESRLAGEAGCLVLDLRLPGMSGLELYRELRSRGLRLPVIFATADEDAAALLQVKTLEAGAMALLPKPCNSEELLRLVQVAFDSQRVR
jgi:FixJ family two-component response regulator